MLQQQKYTWIVSDLFLILTFLFLTACESVGTIQAVSDGKAVTFDYQQDYDDNDGKLSVMMPDGEYFTGKFVQSSSTVSDDGFSFDIEIEVDEDGVVDDSSKERVVVEQANRVTSLAEALLIGDNGNTMTCRFQFSKPDEGIDGGGIGSCKISDDRTVNTMF